MHFPRLCLHPPQPKTPSWACTYATPGGSVCGGTHVSSYVPPPTRPPHCRPTPTIDPPFEGRAPAADDGSPRGGGASRAAGDLWGACSAEGALHARLGDVPSTILSKVLLGIEQEKVRVRLHPFRARAPSRVECGDRVLEPELSSGLCCG